MASAALPKRLDRELGELEKKLKDIEKRASSLKINFKLDESDQAIFERLKGFINEIQSKTNQISDLIKQNGKEYTGSVEKLFERYAEIERIQEEIAENDLKIAAIQDDAKRNHKGRLTKQMIAEISSLDRNKTTLKTKSQTIEADLQNEGFDVNNLAEAYRLQNEIVQAQAAYNEHIEQANLALENGIDLLERQAESTNRLKDSWGNVRDYARQASQDFAAAFNTILKGTQYWREQDDAISKLSSQLGLNTTQLGQYRDYIMEVGVRTETMYGISAAGLSKLMQGYDDATAKAIIFNESQIDAQAQLEKVMGEGNSTEYLAGMEKFGVGIEDARDTWEDIYNIAKEQGVATGKATNDFVKNLRVAEKYNFKGGLDNMKQMSVYASKMRISLETVGDIADKLSNPEGAIEMASRLQVLGGSFSSLANPMAMLYEGMEDVGSLTERVANMFSGIGTFDKAMGEVRINGMDRQRVRAAAEAMGMSYDEALDIVRERAKRDQIEQDVSFKNNLSQEDKDMLSTLAQYNKGSGKFEVQMYNETTGKYEAKNIEEISAEDIDKIRGDERQDMENIVENVISINDRLEQIANGINAAAAVQQENMIGDATRSTLKAAQEGIVQNQTLIGTAKNIYEAVVTGFHTLQGIVSAYMAISSVGSAFGALRNAVPSAVPKWGRSTSGGLRGWGGKASKAFSLKSVAKGAGIGMVAGIGGSALSSYGDKLYTEGKENAGAVASIGGEMLQYAGMGAMFGPVGAAVGALVGVIMGVVKNWDVVSEWVAKLWESIKWVVDKVKGFWKWMADGITGGIKNAWNWITGNDESESTSSSGVREVNDAVTDSKRIIANPNDSIMFAKPGGPIDNMFNNILPKIDEIHSLVAAKPLNRNNFKEVYSDKESSIKEIKERALNQQIIGKQVTNEIIRAIPIGDTKSYFKEVQSSNVTNNSSSSVFGGKGGNDITFSKPLEININGTIKLDAGNGNTLDISSLIKNNPTFVKELTKLISDEVSAKANGGKYNRENNR